MAKVSIDFSEVPDFEALPKGYYPVIVVEVVKKENKAGNGEYLNWTLEVAEGEFANRKLWAITSLKPTGLWKLKEAFEAFGINLSQVDLDIDDDTSMLISPEVVGKACQALVEQQMYQGRLNNKVSALFPINHDPNAKKQAKGGETKKQKFS